VVEIQQITKLHLFRGRSQAEIGFGKSVSHIDAFDISDEQP
jgi:hypothetical protein